MVSHLSFPRSYTICCDPKQEQEREDRKTNIMTSLLLTYPCPGLLHLVGLFVGTSAGKPWLEFLTAGCSSVNPAVFTATPRTQFPWIEQLRIKKQPIKMASQDRLNLSRAETGGSSDPQGKLFCYLQSCTWFLTSLVHSLFFFMSGLGSSPTTLPLMV